MLLALFAMPIANLPEVTIHGALRPIIHEGKIGAVIDLKSLKITKGTIAVGAVAHLDGEITVIDGQTYVSRVRSKAVVHDKPGAGNVGACLLIVSKVPKWRDIEILDAIKSTDFDGTIERLLRDSGLDTGRRIPFQVIGKFDSIKAHVIDGKNIPKGPSSHEAHLKSGVQISEKAIAGTVVGFFSKSDQGVMTHHTTTTHLHGYFPVQKFSGHIDEIAVARGSILRIPALD